jgi:hypothetical protein
MSKPSLVIVLVEDQRQRQLIYRYLKHAGIRQDQMRLQISPSGRGSAEQWVRNSFVVQVRKCRTRQARTGMLVMLDADSNSVDERLRALDEALVAGGQRPIDQNRDMIARLIPKRNVETWILVLSQKASAALLDEHSDYKRKRTEEEWTSLVPVAAATLSEWTSPSAALPDNLIDSLRRGISEIPRALTVRVLSRRG